MAIPLRSPHRLDWRGLLLVGGLAFAGAVAFQGSRGLYETTEGRYAECARETLASGDYDDPILNGEPHWTKPPLTYMAIMAGTRLFGNNPWGARAYLVAAMVLSAGAIWLAGTSIWGPKAGLWAGIVFSTSPFMAGAAGVVSTDLLTTLWVAAGTAAFWHGYARRSPVSLLAMWIFLGLGFMTKGPPALLVPAASLAVAAVLLRRGGAGRLPFWLSWAGLGLFLLVGVLWYIEEAEHTTGLLSYWLGEELIGRNVGGEFHRNPGLRYAFTLYLPILLLGTGPWLPLILWHGRPIKDWWRSAGDTPVWSEAARLSMLAGVAIPFVVFSASTSKLPLYLVPLFVPLSLALGRMIEVLISGGRLQARTAGVWTGLLVALVVVGKGILGFQDSPKDMTRLAAALVPALEREGQPPLYAATGRYLNGLEFHLARQIEFIQPKDVFAHAAERTSNGESPRYVMSKRNWERVSAGASVGMRLEPLGRHWLLLAPLEANGERNPDPATPIREDE